MYEKIQDYLSREITQREYCEQENLSSNAFLYWLRKYRKEHGLSSEKTAIPSGFISLKLDSESEVSETAMNCEIKFPNGVLIRCHTTSINASLVNLIQALMG
jgi:transposase-like protein